MVMFLLSYPKNMIIFDRCKPNMINGDTLWGFEYLLSKFGLLLNVDFELDGRELESRGGDSLFM